jgi:DAK2 domain fusion protein YloV
VPKPVEQRVGESLDGATIHDWAAAALAALGRAREEIDAINVFPVADADTGTNLFLTFESACRALGEGAAYLTDVCPARAVKTLAYGALLGARGNSGVILSQLLRGFAESLAHAPEFDGIALADALARAADLGYRAVAVPVEGTMLTVMRAAADGAARARGAGTAATANAAAAAAREALAHTPKQLAVLREAGVIDAGGRGLTVLLEALAAVVSGIDPSRIGAEIAPHMGTVAASDLLVGPREPVAVATRDGERHAPASSEELIGPAYEVIYLLTADDDAIDQLRDTLTALCAEGAGDSLVIVGGDGLWRVHVHLDEPGPAIEAGIAAGRPRDIHVTYLGVPARRAGTGEARRAVVAVAEGEALAKLFAEGGAQVLPARSGARVSSDELVAAVRATHATEVVLLANGDATLPVAAAAATMLEAEATEHAAQPVRVAVLPTHTPVHGIAALAVHQPSRRFDADIVAMTAAAGATRYGAVQLVTELAVTSAGVCRPGDVLGCVEGDVALIAADQLVAATGVVERMLSAGGEMVTLLVGGGAAEGVADAVVEHVRTHRPDVDVLVYDAGKAGPPLLVGVE